MIKLKCKIYIALIFFILWFANIFLLLKLDEQITVWKRFTYEDWLILYKLCMTATGTTLNDVVWIYWNNQTDFKNYILENYEN